MAAIAKCFGIDELALQILGEVSDGYLPCRLWSFDRQIGLRGLSTQHLQYNLGLEAVSHAFQ